MSTHWQGNDKRMHPAELGPEGAGARRPGDTVDKRLHPAALGGVGPGGLGGLSGVDFRKLGYHNPRLDPSSSTPTQQQQEEGDSKANDIWRGLEPATVEHSGPKHAQPTLRHLAGPEASKELTQRLPHFEQPRTVEDPDQEPYDPVVQGFLGQHPGVRNAPPAIPKDHYDSAEPEHQRHPRAQRIARSIADSPTMRNNVVDVPDQALLLDPTEVRNEPMDEQLAAPMDDVDPYGKMDPQQYKTSI